MKNCPAWSVAAFLMTTAFLFAADRPNPRLVSDGLSGYISMDVPAPPEEFGYGVSLTPPKGCEIGYVPIVTRQSPR